jgi:ABC-type nitrate/sulfonate/bicarbonate transport system permease component/ABC-type nitrate/sulfonate/bicarbonate transport system substrate-binding protein
LQLRHFFALYITKGFGVKDRKITWSILTFIIIFSIWEMVSRSSQNLAFVLPAPSSILHALVYGKVNFMDHSLVTLKEMLGGILISLSIAFPFAWMMYLFGTARYILQPVFLIVQCIPIFTLAPIMVIWFGWSYIAIVVPTALMIFFPLTMTIYEGLKSTPKELIDYFHVNKATPWQVFTKLQLPWAFPQLCAGLRISAAIAGIGAVAGEWAGGQKGLGLLMLESRRSADLETCFAALFCLTLMSLGLFALTVACEKRLLRWKSKKVLAVGLGAWIAVASIFVVGWDGKYTQHRYNLVLDWLPNPDHVPIYVGIEKKIFEKYGIPLEVYKVTDPSDPLGYLTSEKADWAVYYMPDTVIAKRGGAELQAVAKLIGVPLRGLIYREGEGIHKPSDLSGRIAGYSIDGTSTRSLDALHIANNIYPKDMVNIHFDLVTSLGLKKVDYTYGAFWNIECEQLTMLGVPTSYFTVEELGVPTYPELVIVSKSTSKMTGPDLMGRMQLAMQESIDFCCEHPDEAFDYYLAANPDKSESTQRWERKAWEKTVPLLATDQVIDQEAWDVFERWMVEHQIID